jgi:hypothetical protein
MVFFRIYLHHDDDDAEERALAFVVALARPAGRPVGVDAGITT